MKRTALALAVAGLTAVVFAAVPGSAAPAADGPPTRMLIEIYRIAPGQHLAFLENIAMADEANRLAGLPPRQLYVHQDGASWDFLLIQPAETPKDKEEGLAAAWKKLGLPSGVDYFLDFRKFILEHTDTFVLGPTSAAEYLAGRKQK